MIQTSGISTSTIVTMLATLQPTFCGVVATTSRAPPLFSSAPSSREVRSRSGRAEALDEGDRDDRDADQDQDGQRRPETEVQPGEQVVVGQYRHRSGAVVALGEDEDV